MRTDIRSPSESEEFAELAISALMKALMTALHWHVDINIVLSANEVRADVLPFIHVLGRIAVHKTQGSELRKKLHLVGRKLP